MTDFGGIKGGRCSIICPPEVFMACTYLMGTDCVS